MFAHHRRRRDDDDLMPMRRAPDPAEEELRPGHAAPGYTTPGTAAEFIAGPATGLGDQAFLGLQSNPDGQSQASQLLSNMADATHDSAQQMIGNLRA